MKRIAIVAVLVCAWTIAWIGVTKADTVGGLTCGNQGGSGVQASQLFHDANGWSSYYWEYCGNGKTYMLEIQYSNDDSHWFDATGHTIKTSAYCVNGCYKKMANTTLPCSNNLYYRVHYWWYNGQSDFSPEIFLNDC